MGNGVWRMNDYNTGIETFYIEVPTTATIRERHEALLNDPRYTVRERMDGRADDNGFFNTLSITEDAIGVTISTRI